MLPSRLQDDAADQCQHDTEKTVMIFDSCMMTHARESRASLVEEWNFMVTYA